MNRKRDTLVRRLDIIPMVADNLIAAGFDTTKKVRLADEGKLAEVPGVGESKAKKFKEKKLRRVS